MNLLYCFYTLFLLLFPLFPPVFAASNGKNRDTQKLLSFKSSILNPDTLKNWVDNSDPCHFTGVFCNNSNSRVTSLDLTSLSLSTDFSSVSTHLFSIELLTSLSLSSSNISGSIEQPPLCSSSLSEIDLSHNSISGSFSDLSSLSLCSSLSKLNLSFNLLESSKDLKGGSFPARFGLSLTSLDVSGNQLSGDQLLPWVLSQGCEKLSYLALKGNKLVGSFSLSKCSNLEFFDVSSNNISTPIPEFGGNCPKLKHLDLSSNKFVGKIEGNALVGCNSLSLLNVSNNQFSGGFPTLPSSSSLEFVYMGSNKFQGLIPDSLADDFCSNLVELDLSFNNFSGMVPTGFESCNLLQNFDVSSNNFTGDLPVDMLLKMVNLRKLNLAFNNFVGALPDSFSLLGSLESLDLSSNNISGKIPPGICQNPEGKPNYNELTGTIPAGLMNCTNLNWISLSSNKLSGTIPSWIGKLNNLAILKLSNNSFYGELPPELGDCKSLLWLDLNSNLLNGSIPDTLAKQSGKMAIGLVVGKKYVYLRNYGGKGCHGTGNLLEFAGIRSDAVDRIPTMCKFQQIYQGHTQPNFNFNGSMIFLDLSYNNLQGGIPKELGTMYYLSILNLGHNNLSGQIPDGLSGMKNIGVMDLSHNHLSGLIPSSLGGLSFLTEIDLSNNELSGMIPESAQFETFPASRFFNNTGLCGYPLPACDRNSAGKSSSHKKHGKQASLAGSVAMGLLFSLFCIFGLIIVGIEVKKRRKKKESLQDMYMDGNSHSGNNTASAWKFTSNREALSINLATFEKPLQKLTFADLLQATNGFHDDSMIGRGGFGDVYKAKLKDGSVVAIKKLIQISGQGDREFTAEMETIGKIKHRNLVPLLGYCKVGEERLMSAMDTHLSVSTLAGTPGYVPPEYYQSFRCSTKGDVYSYGVVLLELLTGKQPTDSADFGDNNLVGWVKMHAKLKISDVFDPELIKENPNLEIELLQHLKVACACLDDRPWKRPTMIQVMAMFKEIQAGSGLDSSSTITGDDGSFSTMGGSFSTTIDVLADMSIKEVPEGNFK
ncbi:hypothetical protein SOVF_036960 [Spinacia oleracea]|nr:hypothetical protein SOVF_036960 [Spinacia oleracea]